MTPKHIPVLTEEVVKALNLKAEGTYIDCTLGEGGHTRQILESTDLPVKILGFELDSTAIKSAKETLRIYSDQVVILNASYVELAKESVSLGVSKVDGVIFDLGLSSIQLDNLSRGFSFKSQSELNMSMGQTEITAKKVLNTYSCLLYTSDAADE